MKRFLLLNHLRALFIAGALLALLSCNQFQDRDQSNDNRPNVILVVTDDQGYGDLSCHGNPVLETPNLDQLHSQSIRLADFHVAPKCTPTKITSGKIEIT